MNSYTRKKRWKWVLFGVAVIFVTASLWYTNIMVKKIASSERENVKIWADALQRKANLVAYTDKFFDQIRKEERKRAEILADASKNMMSEVNSEVLDIYYKIITGNETIPVIMTKVNDSIIHARNVADSVSNYDILDGALKREFTILKNEYIVLSIIKLLLH
jgi:hypothetical protein